MDKFKKQAYTVAEILIVIMIIGFLAVFVLNATMRMTPDKHKTLFKKAYSIAEKTVQELVNDETLYPYNPNFVGFLNTIEVQVPGEEEGIFVTGDSKFPVLFMDKLNTMERDEITDLVYQKQNTQAEEQSAGGSEGSGEEPGGSGGSSEEPSGSEEPTPAKENLHFTTTDGMYWTIPIKAFHRGTSDDSVLKILVDINGDKKGPNKLASEDPNDPHGDIFEIIVLFDGKVNVNGEVEKKFLSSHTLQKEEH